MKTLQKLVLFLSGFTWIASSQHCPRGDNIPHSKYSSDSTASDKLVQFLAACPTECTCSLASCGLQTCCSGKELPEIPKYLSPLTECLYLSVNNISKIEPESFLVLKDLRVLDLSLNNISVITRESFAPLKKLKQLFLSGNFIRELPRDIFTGFKKMEELYLQDNNLVSIPANAVSKMPNLKALNLGANYISSISSNAFTKLDNLKHVWLDDNELKEIPHRALGKAPTIEALSLDMNMITTIRNGDLDQMVALEVLLLKHNYISRIDNNVFENVEHIQIIDLSYNDLEFPPPAIKDATKLQTLRLSNNKIGILPDLAFAGNLDLRELTLTGNPIKSAGKTSFTGLRKLKDLSLEEAEDMKVFPDLSGCERLSSLAITGGKLKSIPSNLCADLPNLERLTLSGNRLRNLTGLRRCSNLTHLDVSNNDLEGITTEETRNMTKMLDLNLASNRIRHLDADVFSKMNHIVSLNLAYNYFTFLPMRGLGSLANLNISGVRTMLYLPPVALFHNLRSLAAYYPYHCCQVAKIPRKVDEASPLNLMYRPSLNYPLSDDFPLMSSPVHCSPGSGPMTPCDDLLPSTPIMVFWWIAMIASFILNGIILLSRVLRYCLHRRTPTAIPSDEEILRRADSDSPYTDVRMVRDSEAASSHYCLNFSRGSIGMARESDIFDLSLCHLALADFIVTGYTAVILTYDRMTRGVFAEDGAWWQQSPFCHSAGFLITFGTQLAFATVVVMAIERYLATMHPLQTEKHMSKNILAMALLLAWVISIVTAVVTLFGGAGDDTSDKMLGMLPSKSGAMCLPWTTEFPYIAAFVGLHIIVCLMMCTLCSLMFCAKRKQSWLSARKSTRRQVTFAVAVNVIFITPLALLTVSVSGYMTYSNIIAGPGGDYSSPEDGHIVLDMGRLLAFAMFVIPFRPLLNPVLYLSFNKPLRCDLAYLAKKAVFGDTNPRPSFPQRHGSVMETMIDSMGDVALETGSSNSVFNHPGFDADFIRQTVAYDNRAVISSSSAHAPSISLAASTSHTGGSCRAPHERRRRRRYTRSRRTERRTTDTDPTTESEVITFYRGGETVHYNPDRRRKLSIRCGGVNAKDEFQRLVFPRLPNTSSSDHGSDSTVYPIMPGTRRAMTSSSNSRHTGKESPKNLSCDADASDVSSADFMPVKVPWQGDHYDVSALDKFYAENSISLSEAPTSTRMLRETRSDPSDTSYEVDMPSDSINSANLPDSPDENPFFDDRDTAKRMYGDGSNKKIHEEMIPSTSQEASENISVSRRFPQSPMKKDRAASQSSGNNDVHLINRMEKMGNSCEYCDSSASKDSGIHSEIDSTSGASYSDTSIGRRIHYSANGGGLLPCDIITTIGECDISSFAIIPSILNGAAQVKISPLSNPETTI